MTSCQLFFWSRSCYRVHNVRIHFPGRQSVERVIGGFYSSRTAAVIKSTRPMTRVRAYLGRVSSCSSAHANNVFACAIDHSRRRCLSRDGRLDQEIHRPSGSLALPAATLRYVLLRQRDNELRSPVRPLRADHRRRCLSTALNNSRVCRMRAWITGSRFGSMARSLLVNHAN